MLRTLKFTVSLSCLLALLIFSAGLSGCGVKAKGKDDDITDSRGRVQKPKPEDFEGPVADFSGIWSGDCKVFPEESGQLECTAQMEISQMSMLTGETLSLSFKYRVGNRERSAPAVLPPYFIKLNSLNDGSKALGKIGRNAFSVFEHTFRGLAVRRSGGQIAVLAVQVPSLNFTDNTFTFDFMAASSACPSGYCFHAILKKN
jgi:hypothetical protein